MIREYGLTPYTERSITRESGYLEELGRVREKGYAISDGEHILGALSIAAPILNSGEEVIAVLMMAMPSAGVSEPQRSEFIPMVVRAADSISRMVTNGAGANRPG